jgi:hypothetical protein
LKELYIRKKTSSFVSMKSCRRMLLIVKIVDEICRMLSVRENYSAFMLLTSSLKKSVTVLLFNS